MKVLKKIGWLAACLSPFAVMLAVELGMSFCSFRLSVKIASAQGGALGEEEVMAQAAAWWNDHFMMIQIVTQLCILLIFFLWYYFALAKKRPQTTAKQLFTGRMVAVVLCLGAGAYLLTLIFIQGLTAAAPALMEEYDQRMESSGLGDLTLLSIIVTVILAPLMEELVFRGLTLHFAKRLTGRFFWANIIQAVLFGVVHLNFIQGLYAFGLGLLLGYFREKYDTLLASILLHASYNFFSACLAVALKGIEDLPDIFMFLTVLLSGVLLTFLALRLMKTDLKELAKKRGAVSGAEQAQGLPEA